MVLYYAHGIRLRTNIWGLRLNSRINRLSFRNPYLSKFDNSMETAFLSLFTSLHLYCAAGETKPIEKRLTYRACLNMLQDSE
jgi:hypothetical protein